MPLVATSSSLGVLLRGFFFFFFSFCFSGFFFVCFVLRAVLASAACCPAPWCVFRCTVCFRPLFTSTTAPFFPIRLILAIVNVLLC